MATAWGASAPFSLPKPREDGDMVEVDMEGFVFTPTGLRVNMTQVDRDEIVAASYRPQRRVGDGDG